MSPMCTGLPLPSQPPLSQDADHHRRSDPCNRDCQHVRGSKGRGPEELNEKAPPPALTARRPVRNLTMDSGRADKAVHIASA
jgi:hypothetical protein